MDETETQDFMNVESFSQLPFIRRTPPPTKEKASKIRLFGQELIGDNSNSQQQQQDHHQDLSADSSDLTTTTKNDQETSHEDVKDKEKEKDNNNRRFECHYCFRNFPTSQALGGHQNAHKRERQHAKRGSYLNHHDPHHHVYGYLNHHHRQYPSWTTDARTFYGGGGQQQTSSYYSRNTLPSPTTTTPPTINGSPLGLWRVPSSTTTSNVYSSASMFTTHEQEPNKEPNWSYRMMKPNVQDHVSLDLHL